MNARSPTALHLGLMALAASASACALWLVLSALAKPADYQPRREALGSRVALIERLSNNRSDRYAYGPHAVCPSLEGPELERMRQGVLGAAAASGVRLTYLVTRPPDQLEDSARLAGVQLQVQAQAPYDALSNFVDRLAAGQPEIFVDHLDLVAANPDVVLKLSGKVFCWTSANR